MKIRLHKRTAVKGFTLAEVLVVVSIIIILMTLTIGGMGYVNTKKAEESANVQVRNLTMHLQSYKTDTGQLPPETKDPGMSSNEIYKVLFGDFENKGRPDDGATVYMEDLDPNISKGKKGAKLIDRQKNAYLIIDPWGQPYRYRRGFNEGGGPNAKNPDFDIWSIGKDGRDGTKDDITN